MKRQQRVRNELGSSSVEVVIIFPIVLGIILAIVQVGIAAHAHSVAEAAAQEGAAAARRFDGSAGAGEARTVEYLNQLGPTILQDRSVNVQRSATKVTVTVTGKVVSVVPGLNLEVSKSASGPVERYVAPERQP